MKTKLKTKLRNKFEDRIFEQLKKTRRRFTYENERLPYTLVKYYVPDFIVQVKGKKIYIECKGYLRPEAKTKMVAVKKQNPGLDIRMLFYAYKAKDIRWAEKHGFPYAIGTVPEEWYT